MARRSLVLVLAVVCVLSVASVSQSRSLALSATAEFIGSGSTWQERLANTGTETIKCTRTFAPTAPPVTFSNVTGPSGTQSQPSQFGNASLTLAPGQTVTFTFQTSGPLTIANLPIVRISSDCVGDANAQTSLAAPPPPPPPPAVCECKRLTVAAKNYSSSEVNRTPTVLKMTLQWTMACSKGNGLCTGKLKLLPPAGSDVKIVTPKNTTVTCNGKCDPNGNFNAAGGLPLKVTSKDDLDFDNRAGKTFVFPIQRYCVRNGKDVLLGTEKLSLVFGAGGFLDKKKSDLNGNKIADGREKK